MANVGTNTVTWNGAIAVSASVTITINATVEAGTGGQTVSNQGTISYDSNSDNINDATRQTDDPGQGGAADPTVFTVGAGFDPSIRPFANDDVLNRALRGLGVVILRACVARDRRTGKHGGPAKRALRVYGRSSSVGQLLPTCCSSRPHQQSNCRRRITGDGEGAVSMAQDRALRVGLA